MKIKKIKEKRFYYFLTFSPYMNSIMAKNRIDAWKKLKKLWPNYNIKKVITLC